MLLRASYLWVWRKRTILIVPLLCCGLNTLAQLPVLNDTAKIHQLQEVLINAGNQREVAISASPLQLLSGKQLDRLSSFSVAEAIRYFSGVQLKDYGGIGGLKTINVRSMGSNHTAVFYDGIELGNAQNGQVDLGKFSLDNIDAVALYNGQKSTIFQPAKGFTSGSSLYLSSKRPLFRDSCNSIEKITLKTGSFGLINPSFLWQYKLSPHSYNSFNSELINANGQYKFRYTNGVYDTTAVRQNGDIRAVRFEDGLYGIMKDSSSWSARGYYYQSERGLPGAIIANKFNYSQRLWDRDFFVQSSYQTNTNKRYSLMANLKYANNYTRYLDPEYITTTGFLDNRYREQQIYLSLANRYRINSWWDIDLSADYLWDKLDANIYHFPYPVRQTELMALATQFHFYRLDIQANLLGTLVQDKVSNFTGAGNKQEYTPTILLSWQPLASPNLRLRGFYKNIFRMPTLNDLYYTVVGYPFLRPEFTKQYNAGFTYQKNFTKGALSSIAVQTDAYYNQVTDKIVAIPNANLNSWTMFNIGKVAIKGLEINAQALWQLTGEFVLHTSANYTRQRALDDSTNQQIPYIPLNSGSFLAGADWRRLSVNYSFIYVGYRYDQKANIPANYLQPWYTHDLSASYTAPVKHHQVKFSVEVNNLLNQYYEVITNFPMPGRAYRFSISYTY
ncbi:TonB-dependent receptor [Mucilaginibacter paludis DSM 18603]|uniref:TonB-dependent receptor n=2 Tax=Mucilaginibacter TaxID=423349 RepID=H1Y9L8_9SPHI|nr:TonB-dependent receptor [Mucilaginibacter paludis DSM 18603]